MNKKLILNIDETVGICGELWILGDFSYKIARDYAAAWRKKIVCKQVHLVHGNHDRDKHDRDKHDRDKHDRDKHDMDENYMNNHDIDERHIEERHIEERKRALLGVVYGAAVGDALGVPFEFRARGSFTCAGMTGHGTYNMPKGTFSDDTSMLLATLESLRVCGGVNTEDMRERFCSWRYKGNYTADGAVFGVGLTTTAALAEGQGCDGEYSNGNGSLMRIAPLAFVNATDAQISQASAITHAHELSCKACVVFVCVLRQVLSGVALGAAVQAAQPDDTRFAFMERLEGMPREAVRSTGYVLDTLAAALWCALHTSSYCGCVLEAVNLGDDTDTTACVAGALAGARYGFEGIPKEWLDDLRGKDVIDRCLYGASGM